MRAERCGDPAGAAGRAASIPGDRARCGRRGVTPRRFPGRRHAAVAGPPSGA